MYQCLFFSDSAPIETDADSTSNYSFRSRPFGPYALANTLRNNNYSSFVIDYFQSFTTIELETILEKLITKDTLFIGYSLTYITDFVKHFIDWERFRTLNFYIKNKYPNVKIIIGGGQVEYFMQKILPKFNDNCGIDYCFNGYAETMLLDFCYRLSNNKNPKFSLITQNIKIIDYDRTASAHDFKNIEHIWKSEDIIIKNEPLPIEIARGCVFRCKFCTYPLLGKNKNDNSYIKSETILLNEFTKNYNEFGTLDYMILDDTFNEKTDKIESLVRIRDKTKLDLSFVGYARLDLIQRKPQQLQLLKDMNFIGYTFGIESLNYDSAKIIGKGIKATHIIETLQKIKDIYNNNVIIQTNFIIGLPYDNAETILNWSEIIFQRKVFLSDFSTFNTLVMYGGFDKSQFALNPEKYGYQRSPTSIFDWTNKDWNFQEANKLTLELRKRMSADSETKIPPFRIPGAIKLGFTRQEIFSTSLSKLKQIERKEHREEKFIQTYKNKLLNFIN